MTGKSDKPRKNNLTVRFTDEELRQLEKIGQAERRPVANLVNWIVARYLAEQIQ